MEASTCKRHPRTTSSRISNSVPRCTQKFSFSNVQEYANYPPVLSKRAESRSSVAKLLMIIAAKLFRRPPATRSAFEMFPRRRCIRAETTLEYQAGPVSFLRIGMSGVTLKNVPRRVAAHCGVDCKFRQFLDAWKEGELRGGQLEIQFLGVAKSCRLLNCTNFVNVYIIYNVRTNRTALYSGLF